MDESILVVSGSLDKESGVVRGESRGSVTGVRCWMTGESRGATVSRTASRFCTPEKRKEGSPAITKMKAKSSINMSVFLLTAAKVIIIYDLQFTIYVFLLLPFYFFTF